MVARTGHGIRGRRLVLTLTSVLLALGLGYAVLADAMANIMSRTAPGLALSWRPGHVRSLESQAALDLEQSPAEVDTLAHRALARDLSFAGPVRILGLSTGLHKDQSAATALLAAAEQLSRRDLPTQLYFIEAAVTRGNVEGALRHFDIAMRTSKPGRDILAPVLCQAMRDPGLTVPIARLLQSAPEWTNAFVSYCVDQPDSRPALARILTLAPAARAASPHVVLAKAVQLVAEAGDVSTAHRLYAAVLKDDDRMIGKPVSNPLFDDMAPLPPFDWNYVLGADLGADPEGKGISIHANGQTGVVASQLLMAKPGRYRLHVVGRDVAGGRVAVTLDCASGHGSLSAVTLPADAHARQVSADVTIQAGCPMQWLRIGAESHEGETMTARVERVDLIPVAAIPDQAIRR
jgi:hypothetical protein